MFIIKAPQRYSFKDIVSFAFVTNNGDPISYRDATSIKDNDKRLVAIIKKNEVTVEKIRLNELVI